MVSYSWGYYRLGSYTNFAVISTHICIHPSICVEYTSELNNIIGHSFSHKSLSKCSNFLFLYHKAI